MAKQMEIGATVFVGDRRMTVTWAVPGFYVARDGKDYYYSLGFDGGRRHLDETAAIAEAKEAIRKMYLDPDDL